MSTPALIPKQTQAAAIASDALTQLRAERLIATKMTYLNTPGSAYHEFMTGKQLTENPCYVCGQGALVVGYMTRRADEALGDYDERSAEVAAIFGPETFDLIENCFEGFGNDDNVALVYRQTFSDNHVRLEKILENIIRNGGGFQPWQDLAAV